MRRRPLASIGTLGLTLLCTCWPARAAATSTKAQCVAAYEDGQRLQLVHNLANASERFAFCAEAKCPAAVQRECKTLLDSVRAALPVVALRIVDEAGAELLDARIVIDDAVVQPFMGEPLRLNPGEHRFRIEAEGYRSVTREVSLTDADSASVEVRLSPACGAADDPSSWQVEPGQPLPKPIGRPLAGCDDSVPAEKPELSRAAPVIVPATNPKPRLRIALLLSSSAVSVLGGVGFAYFGMNARRGEHDLGHCSPNCTEQAVNDVRRDYLLANVALGVGFAALVGTAVGLIAGNSAPTATQPASARRWDVRIGPISTLSGSF